MLKNTIKILRTYKLSLLLLTLALQIFVPVFINNYLFHNLVVYILISLTMAVSLLVFKDIKQRKLFLLVNAFVFVVLLINWIDYFGDEVLSVKLTRLALLAGLYVFIFINIFKEFARRGEVDLDFIFGAISAYLLLGLLGAVVSVIIDYYYPGSYAFANSYLDFQDFVYFNFVTLSTLGYGDMLPQTPQAQMHAVAIALAGQLYLTITIALIVGRYLANPNKKRIIR